MTTHEPALPRAMDGTYRVLACKKAIGDSAVFLAVHRGTGREVLIKIASSAEKGLYLKNEYQLLKRLEGIKAPEPTLFPRAMDFLSLDDVCVLVREYLPGQTMEDYVESEPARRRAFAVLAILALLLALYSAGTALRGADRPYSFREPLIEQAVRRALGRPEGALTAKALTGVTKLHIFGRHIYDDDGEFWFLGENAFPYDEALRRQASWKENGGIVSLDDLKALPNLTELSLYRQSIADISALSGMRLRALGIGYNPVTDLSPLANNEALERLNLSGLDISDTAVLPTLPALRSLSISATAIESLPELPLTALNIVDAPFHFETLPLLPRLENLTVSKLLPDHLFYLSHLPLKSLEVTHAQGLSPRDLEVLSGLERLSFRTEQRAVLSAEPLHFPRMDDLVLKGVAVESLACLSELSNLRTLGIYETDCADYGGLEGLARLETVWATAGQAAALEALYPLRAWALVIV